MNTDWTGFYTCKECHKTESLEIIPLQITRKEKNWKTEETLARVVVTLRRNGSKGPILDVYDDDDDDDDDDDNCKNGMVEGFSLHSTEG